MSDKEKIIVLEKILMTLKENKELNKDYSLCSLFNEYSEKLNIRLNFKDFKWENVKKVTGEHPGFAYWWSVIPFDYDNRIKFISWMIERIKTGKEGIDE